MFLPMSPPLSPSSLHSPGALGKERKLQTPSCTPAMLHFLLPLVPKILCPWDSSWGLEGSSDHPSWQLLCQLRPTRLMPGSYFMPSHHINLSFPFFFFFSCRHIGKNIYLVLSKMMAGCFRLLLLPCLTFLVHFRRTVMCSKSPGQLIEKRRHRGRRSKHNGH